MAIIVLHYEMEVDTAKVILWYIDVSGLKLLKMKCLFVSKVATLVVRSDGKFHFLTNVLEEDLLFEDLAPLLKIGHVTLLHYNYT